MLRSRIAALSIGLTVGSALSGCLDPLVSDDAGYSRHLLPAGSELTSVSNDPTMARRIDMADGISMGKAALKSGFAVGLPVKYWELGAGRGSATPAYKLAHCDSEGQPLIDPAIDHPLLVDALPGDADYSQLWAINFVCVTSAYQGQVVATMSALSDLYELGLATEPTAPLAWEYHPIVQEGVALDGGEDYVGFGKVYARGMWATALSFGEDGTFVTTNGKSVNTGYAYELTKPGSSKVERVIFSSPQFTEEGLRSEAYAPVWTVVTVVVAADADINSFSKESDVATVNADKTFTKAGPSVVTVTATTNRVARPIQFPRAQ